MEKGRVRRKVNIFFVFLICSSLAWLVSRLSEDYTQGTSFDLLYINVPDSLRLSKASKDALDVRLRANGFQFLGFNFKSKQIAIDLSKVQLKNRRYYIAQKDYRKQIQNQLTTAMTLLEADRDTLFFEFYKVFTKEVPLQADIAINLGQNYLLENEVELSPKTVVLSGPKEEINAVNFIRTSKLELTDVSADFENVIGLDRPDGLTNTTLSINSVLVKGKVFRFSERILDIPIKVVNLPEGTEIRTFPEKVAVLCKGRIDNLKALEIDEFELVGDYANVNNRKTLTLKLTGVPELLHSAQLLENEVEFILKRE